MSRTLKAAWLIACVGEYFVASAHPQSTPAEKGFVRLQLLRSTMEHISPGMPSRNFYFQLPEHVQFARGSAVYVVVHSAQRFAEAPARLSLNGMEVAGANLEQKIHPASGGYWVQVKGLLPERALRSGWNRMLLQLPVGTSGQVPYTLWKDDCFVVVAFERHPIFPELARFPATFGEEKLLRPGLAEPQGAVAAAPLAITLPQRQRDVHLRGCAIVAARVGQLGYLEEDDCRLAFFDGPEVAARHRILIGRKDELPLPSLPPELVSTIQALRPGHGLLAEFMQGKFPGEFRCLVLTGGDDPGLEKALLTVGSAKALASLPNPALVVLEPGVDPLMEAGSRPGPSSASFSEFGWKPVILTPQQAEYVWSGWRLPPGYEVISGSLQLRLSYPTNLANSWLEVLVNGQGLGRVELNPGNLPPGVARLDLPNLLPGADPMVLTFRCSLHWANNGSFNLQQISTEPSLAISGESILECDAVPRPVRSLEQPENILLGDSFLRAAAFLLPDDARLETLELLKSTALRLGSYVPSAPALWPEACQYGSPTKSERLRNRSVLVFGAVKEWTKGLPPGTRIPLEFAPDSPAQVSIQGRPRLLAGLEPSLVFLHLAPSPWSMDHYMILAGGWDTIPAATLRPLLTTEARSGRISGNLVARDASGRLISYDTRKACSESLAERLQSRIPAGLSVAETSARLKQQELTSGASARWNRTVSQITGVVLALLIVVRVLFTWQRARGRRKALKHDLQPVTAS